MMVAIFATMALSLVSGRYGPRWLAWASVLACFGLAAGLFLWEIYSPEYGFRMPWLQTMGDGMPHTRMTGDRG